jgi:hypothetical protein
VSPQTVDSPHPPSISAMAVIDVRAQHVLDELAAAHVEHTRALVRLRLAAPGSDEHAHARENARELSCAIAQLERSLEERPWTEL